MYWTQLKVRIYRTWVTTRKMLLILDEGLFVCFCSLQLSQYSAKNDDFIKVPSVPSLTDTVLKTSSITRIMGSQLVVPVWMKPNKPWQILDSSPGVSLLSSLEVRCPPIVTLKNISLSPPPCGKRAMLPGSTCLLTCRQGYALRGNRKAVCLGSGNWTANVQKAICSGKCVCDFFLIRIFVFWLLRSEVGVSCKGYILCRGV